MGHTSVASVPAPSQYHSGPYLRVQQRQQSQQTSAINPQELIKMNQYKRLHQSATKPPPMTPPWKTPTGLTTLSPFRLKLQAISGTPNKISRFITTPTATEMTSSGTRQCEQERVRAKNRNDRLIISFKNLPRRTDGTSTKEAVKSLAAVKIDDTQPTPRANDHSRSRSLTTTRCKTLQSELMPMLESKLEPDIESEVETELEAEESGSQRGTRGRMAERWIMDALVIPIPRWLQYYKRR